MKTVTRITRRIAFSIVVALASSLSAQTVTPRIIIEEEPEELLGIDLPEKHVAPQTATSRSSTAAFTRMYYVEALVTPFDINAAPGTKPVPEMASFQRLKRVLTKTIEPASWSSAGGSGAIEEFPTNLSLVVSQTLEVHQKVADALNLLHYEKELREGRNPVFETRGYVVSRHHLQISKPLAEELHTREMRGIVASLVTNLFREALEQNVARMSWKKNGGRGWIRPGLEAGFDVFQTADGHDRIAELLTTLASTDTRIALDVQFVSVPMTTPISPSLPIRPPSFIYNAKEFAELEQQWNVPQKIAQFSSVKSARDSEVVSIANDFADIQAWFVAFSAGQASDIGPVTMSIACDLAPREKLPNTWVSQGSLNRDQVLVIDITAARQVGRRNVQLASSSVAANSRRHWMIIKPVATPNAR